MPSEETVKNELVDSLKGSIKDIKDADLLKLVKQYIKIILSADEHKEFINQIIESNVEEEEQAEFEVVIQDVESKILDINSNLLDFIGLVNERGALGKSELSDYFITMIKGAMKELKTIDGYLDRWVRTIKTNPNAIKGDMMEKSRKWLKTRTSGPLVRIGSGGEKMQRILSKIERENAISEADRRIQEHLGIIK